MCPVTMSAIAAGTMATISTVGSAVAAGASAVGSAAMAAGSAIGSGLSAVGSSIASGASAAWGGISSAYSATTAAMSEAFAVGAASEAGTSGLLVEGALVGSTEATALNAGAEAAMLSAMMDSGVAMTAENLALATQGATAAAKGSTVAKIAAATAGAGGIGGAAQIAASALSAASGGVEAYGAVQQGKEEAANLKAKAKVADLQAQQQLDAAEIEAKDLARRQRQAVGKGKVAAAANGVMLEARAESAPAMWEQDMAAELAWDREKLFHNANQRARAYYEEARQLRIGAKNVRRSSNLKAATALIKGGVGAVSPYIV